AQRRCPAAAPGDVAALPADAGERPPRHRALHAEGDVVRRAALWAGIAVAVVLATRTFVYALVPQSLVVGELEGRAGRPQVLAAALVASAVAVLAGLAVLWLAAVAVRERLALEQRAPADVPLPTLRTLALRVALLAPASALAFAYV